MSKKVLVTYKNNHGEIIGSEKNLLIEPDDVVLFGDDQPTGITPFDLAEPGQVLLEDKFGMWNIDREDVLAIVPAEFDSLDD